MFSQIGQIFSHIIRTRLAASLILMLALPIAARAQVVTVDASPTSIMEGKSATFIISVTPAPTSNLTVNIEVSGNVLPNNYTPPTRITVGTSGTATLIVPTRDFTENPNDENWGNVRVDIKEGDGYTIGESEETGVNPGSTSVQVIDADADENPPATVAPLPVVTLHTDQTRVAIGDRVTVTIKRTEPYNYKHRVDFRVGGHLPDITEWQPMVEMLHPQSANRHPPGERSYSFRVQEEACGHTQGRKIEAFLLDAYYYGDNLLSGTGDSAYKVGNPSSVTIDVYAPPNWQPTGAPTISGTLDENEVLTVSHDLSGVTGYQWYRGSNPISSETGNTYTIVSDDSGHRLKVRVTFNNGTCEIESALTGVVGGEMPVGTIVGNPPSIIEGQSKRFRITMDPAPTAPLNAEVRVSQIGDFITGSPGEGTHTVSFNANQKTATITVDTEDDQVDEEDGEISAQLIKKAGYDVGDPDIATVIVEDNDNPRVTIEAVTTPITEGDNAEFTITADPVPATPLTVTVSVTETRNFISSTPPTTVSFNANQATATLTVNTENDNIDELDGQIRAQLQNGTDYTRSSPSSATVTVEDDDMPQLSIGTDQTVAESAGSMEFTVTLNGPNAQTVTVDYETSDGTAEQPGDYTRRNGRLTFSPTGSRSQTIRVTIRNDNIDENNETFTMTLSNVSNATLEDDEATGTITDDDTRGVRVDPTSLNVPENGNNTYKVVLESQPTENVTVSVNVPSNTDVSVNRTSLTFTTGNWRNAQTVRVNADDDTDSNSDPPVTITHTVSGGDYAGESAASVIVTIVENDISTLSIDNTSASESAGTMSFTVRLSVASTQPVTVDYATSNGTATAGEDYTADNGTLTFPASSTASQTISVTIANDDIDEDNETLTVTLSNASNNAMLAGGSSTLSATGTIQDNDTRGVRVSPTSLTVNEGSNNTYTVILTSEPTATVRVGVAKTSGSSEDVTVSVTSLTFPTNTWNTAQTVTVSADQDTDSTNDSATVQHTVSGGDYNNVTATSVIVTVDDDENPSPPTQQPPITQQPPTQQPTPGTPTVTISAGTSPITEGTDATFTLTADPAPTSALKVQVNVTQTGKVLSGTPTSSVTFKANQSTATLRAATDDDDVRESDGTITARVTVGTNYTVGDPSSASITVNDNDTPPNHPATGAPIIRGPPQLGQTLTADVSNIRDANGLENVTYAYQWIRVMDSVEMEISGATDSTYEVVTADSGYRLKVRVNFTDDVGYPEELESALTNMVIIPGVTPVITITATPPSVTEGTAATFTLTATPAPTITLTVNISVTETAKTLSGTPPSTVTISAGQTTLTVATDDDKVDEHASVVTAQVQAGMGYTVGTPSSARVLVLDDDLPPAIDATLSNLTINPGVMTPSFASVTLYYTALVPHDAPSVTITATPNNPDATVTINGQTTTSLNIPFTRDTMDVTVTVTAVDGVTQLTYTITVNRAPTGMPQVTITANPKTVTEGTAATFTITANQPSLTDLTVKISVTETAKMLSGTPPSTVTISAGYIIATLTVATDDDDVDEHASVVTAQLKAGTGYTIGTPSSAKVFVLDDEVVLSTDATLSDLTINPGTLNPALDPDTYTYTATVPHATTSVTVTAIPNHMDATVTINGQTATTLDVSLAEGENTITVVVTAEDGTTQLTYTITVNREAPLPQVTISAETSPITEGTAATFTITATPAPTTELTVNANITETGNVISGTPPSTITINANETTATLTVATDDDNVDEEASAITAALRAGTGYTVGTPSSASVTVNDNDAAPNSPATGAPTIIGTPEVGETLTADVSNIRDADGLTNVSYIYQWIRVMGGVETEIIGATGVTYEVTAADIGHQIKVRVNFNDDLGNAEELESELTADVTTVVTAPVVPVVTISANTTSVTEGTAATFTITATPAPTTAITVNVNITETGNVISGTPTSTFTISAGQTTLTVATDDDNVDEEASAITAVLQAGTGYTLGTPSSASVTVNDNDIPPNSPATGTPTITGTPKVGETLTADVSNIRDANGLANVSYTYQWIRLVGSVETEIIGATGVTYEVTITDTDRQLKVRVNFTDDLGYDEELESAWTAVITPEEPRVVKLDGWLARFGRTASNHVVETVRERVRGHVGTNHVVIGGYNLHEMNTNGLFFNPTLMPGDSPMRFSIEAAQSAHDKEILKQIISSTSFALSGTLGPYSEPRWAVWGRGATTRFSGTDADQTVEGDVTSVMLGIDYGDNFFQGGLVLSYAMGDGILGTIANTRDEWSVETTLTGIYPWARLALTNKFSVWGMLGYGGGNLPLSLEGIEKLETDANMVMGALGTRTDLIGSTYHDGFSLSLASDAVLSRANADDLRDLLENKGTASRVRVLLEGSHVLWVLGGPLQPLVELGMRYDGGDADTGMGIEFGAGMRYVLASMGLMVEGRVRGLIAHQEGSYEEWGGSGTIRLSPNPSGEGLSLRVSPTWGDASGSARALWSRPDMSDIASGRNSGVFASNRVSAEVVYGVPVLGDKLIATPFVGLQNRHKRLGVGLHRGSLFGFAIEGMQHNRDLALRVRAGMYTQHIILRLEGSLDTYGRHAYLRLHREM